MLILSHFKKLSTEVIVQFSKIQSDKLLHTVQC